jgi:hypothetical protein
MLGPSRLSAETKARLIVWLLLIRSRIRRLGAIMVWQRYGSQLGFAIQRPHSPIDRVLRGWMEGVVVMSGEGAEHPQSLLLLRTLIELLLHEARGECDYRSLFPFIIKRINVHVARLMQEVDPFLIGEVVFIDLQRD